MPCRSTRSPIDSTPAHRSLLRVLLALALVLAAGPPSAALAGEAEVRRAREHHKAGDQAFKEGRYQDAYREWEAGFELSGRPLFLLNMAHAERRRGELHSARSLYRRFLLMEPQTKLRGEVESVLAEIETALPENPTAAQATPDPAAAASSVPPPVAPANLLGSPAEPPPSFISTSVPDSDETSARPLYKRWWFWTGVGVLAAAGGASFFLLRGDSYTKTGSLGTIGAGR